LYFLLTALFKAVPTEAHDVETWSFDEPLETPEGFDSRDQSPDCLTPDIKPDLEQEPDIQDPWELPVEYAEDLYTGGDAPVAHVTAVSPSHITENDDVQLIPRQKSSLHNGNSLGYEEAEVTESGIRNSTGKGKARADPYAVDEPDYDELEEDAMSREATPEPETPAVRERLRENLFATPPDRHRSPTFALNDQVDWTTPSFDDRISHSRLIHDEGETGSEVTSEEEILSISDNSEGLYDGRSPPPLGTSDLDPHAQDGDDELDDYDDEQDDPSFSGSNHPATALDLTGEGYDNHEDDDAEVSDDHDGDDDEPHTQLAAKSELAPECELPDLTGQYNPSQRDTDIPQLHAFVDMGPEQPIAVVQGSNHRLLFYLVAS
jgi:hypothetical protein